MAGKVTGGGSDSFGNFPGIATVVRSVADNVLIHTKTEITANFVPLPTFGEAVRLQVAQQKKLCAAVAIGLAAGRSDCASMMIAAIGAALGVPAVGMAESGSAPWPASTMISGVDRRRPPR